MKAGDLEVLVGYAENGVRVEDIVWQPVRIDGADPSPYLLLTVDIGREDGQNLVLLVRERQPAGVPS